jgi:hypothetical protein
VGAAHVLQHVADDLFAAVGRGVAALDELTVLSSGAEQTLREAMATQMSAGGPAQANLDRLVWEGEDSSWQDGKQDWLP